VKERVLKNKLVMFAMVLVFGFGLFTTGCAGPTYTEIHVTNASSETISVTIFRQEEHGVFQRHHVWSVEPEEVAVWQDTSGRFRITATVHFQNTQFHFPRGGGSVTQMEGRENFIFDGEPGSFNLRRK